MNAYTNYPHVHTLVRAAAFRCSSDALRAAIAAHEDVDTLQKLCEGMHVPDELRADLWKVTFTDLASSHSGIELYIHIYSMA